jgi:hypothetical protein
MPEANHHQEVFRPDGSVCSLEEKRLVLSVRGAFRQLRKRHGKASNALGDSAGSSKQGCI